MKKKFLKRGIATALSLVMAFSTAIPSSLVYAGENPGIESEIVQGSLVTLTKPENGNLFFISNGDKTQEPKAFVQGTKVDFVIDKSDSCSIAKLEVMGADGMVLASLENGLIMEADGIYSFVMPDADVSVSATLEEASTDVSATDEAEAGASDSVSTGATDESATGATEGATDESATGATEGATEDVSTGATDEA